MDSHSQSHRPFSSFNSGLGVGPTTFSAYHYPSRQRPQNDFEDVDIHNFSDQIPNEDSRPRGIATRQPHHEIDTGHNDYTDIHRRSLTKSLFWPTLVLITPITLLATALLALVFAYEVRTDPDLFQPAGQASQGSSSHILVNFSATRLVFVASFLSSVAPILTSFVMTLWTLPAAESIRLASLEQDYAQLPTAYQLSLLIGMTLASYERLWRYLAYIFSPSRSSIPRVVHQAAAMLMLTTLLALAVFGSDTALHFTTTTIPFTQITNIDIPNLGFGRGLTEACLNFNRSANNGLPCTYDYIEAQSYTEVIAETNEVFRLQHNDSEVSELLTLDNNSLRAADYVVLAQLSTTIGNEIDYKASTIGVTTQCSAITSKCNMRTDPANVYHTNFRCSGGSEGFWGVLGAAPAISQTFEKAVDSNVPGLAYKPASNIQYAYYNDSELTLPYNTIGYNSSGDQAYPPLPNADLINPIYFAFAGRIGFGDESAGSQINSDSEVFVNVTSQNAFYDFVLNCTITSYDVDLTFSNGTVQDFEAVPTNNGSVLEMFHGTEFYVTYQTGAPDLQDYLDQVALQNTSAALAREWGILFSQKVLSSIGGYTTPRTNLAQQQRTSMLVASVQKSALGALVACSFAYTMLGLILCSVAYAASKSEVRDLAAQLSLAGLVSSAFGDKTISPSSAGTEKSSRMSDQKLTREEAGVAVLHSKNQSFGYQGWM